MYDTHPIHVFPWLSIQYGHTTLARQLSAFMQQTSTPIISIDGFVGLEWSVFIDGLQAALADLSVEVAWLSTDSCLLPADQIAANLDTYLTDDPVFGRLFHGHLEELWDAEAVKFLRQRVKRRACATIVYGFGSSLLVPEALQIYVDVPKDRGQELARLQRVCNVGAERSEAFGALYKRLYFVDWPMLNQIKRKVLPHLALFVDGADSLEPHWVEGSAFRQALQGLARRPFRVKPWFAPGS